MRGQKILCMDGMYSLIAIPLPVFAADRPMHEAVTSALVASSCGRRRSQFGRQRGELGDARPTSRTAGRRLHRGSAHQDIEFRLGSDKCDCVSCQKTCALAGCTLAGHDGPWLDMLAGVPAGAAVILFTPRRYAASSMSSASGMPGPKTRSTGGPPTLRPVTFSISSTRRAALATSTPMKSSRGSCRGRRS